MRKMQDFGWKVINLAALNQRSQIHNTVCKTLSIQSNLCVHVHNNTGPNPLNSEGLSSNEMNKDKFSLRILQFNRTKTHNDLKAFLIKSETIQPYGQTHFGDS